MSLILLVVGPAAQAKDVGIVMGMGANSCAEFAEQYRANPKQTEIVYFFWAQGFMSAWNLANLSAKQPHRDLAAWQIGDQQLKLRKFCNDKPLATFLEAVESLYKSLPELPPQSN